MSDRLPPIVREYASELQMSIEVAQEHYELYYDRDENRVRNAIENRRTGARETRLLDGLTPSVAYDNEVLRAVGEFASPVRVGDLSGVLMDRWPAQGRRYLTGKMWSGQRIAQACQRLAGDGFVRAEPVQIGAGATQVALAYSLTKKGGERAHRLGPNDPRPDEWR